MSDRFSPQNMHGTMSDQTPTQNVHSTMSGRSFLQNIHISAPSPEIAREVKHHWDTVAKPLDGMGRFEELYSRIGAIQNTVHPNLLDNAVLVFCADNGIVAEGVSQSGPEVTRTCAENLGQGKTSVCAMAEQAHVMVVPVDVGIRLPEEELQNVQEWKECLIRRQERQQNRQWGTGTASSEEDTATELHQRIVKKEKELLHRDRIPGVENEKVASGTRNFLREPAMTEEQTIQALETGIHDVDALARKGCGMIGIGELGIGNTTTSACVASALLGCEPSLAVGRGAGLSDNGLHRKLEVVKQGLEKWQLQQSSDPFHILTTVGGLDIAAMAGACIGGAMYHVPIVLDGVISMTAALVAERLVPGIRDFLIPSHMSREPAAQLIAEELDLHPVINADMALGEGTGAVMMMSLLQMADSVYRNCVSFTASGVAQYHRYEHSFQMLW